MFKWYMTENCIFKVLGLISGLFKFYGTRTFCTGLGVLPNGIYWSPAFGY